MTDFDGAWKEALDLLLPEFLELLQPHVYHEIDWSHKYEPLAAELQRIAPEAESGVGTVDRLYRVKMKDGVERYLHVHIEVQCQFDAELERRVFRYQYRLFDLLGRVAVTIVVFGDDNPGWRPDRFQESSLGSGLSGHYNTIKLLDWRARTEELERSPNAFAPFFLAHLRTLETRKDPEARAESKFQLWRGLFERGLTKERIAGLSRLIDWIMNLPKPLDDRLNLRFQDYLRSNQVPYVSSFEEMFMSKFVEKGIEKGKARGEIAGRIRMAQQLLLLPESTETELDAMPEPDKLALLADLQARLRNRLSKV